MSYRPKVHGGTFWEDGRRYTILLEPEIVPAQMRDQTTACTVDHEPIPADALEFSVSGIVYHATKTGAIDRRYSEGISYGQNVDDLRKVKSTRAQCMADLWERWHLNGMRAACAHQERDAGLDSKPCPVTGYQWGHAWLYEPIPPAVLAEIRSLFGLPVVA